MEMEKFQLENRGTLPITVDLKSIDLNASHLLISAFASTHDSNGSISTTPIESVVSQNQNIFKHLRI